VALLDFVDALLVGSEADLTRAREKLLEEMGPASLVDAAAVVGNFQMMNRVADATGMPVGKGTLKRTKEWRELLGLDRFNHL
jgi:alkylhydroperoxidase family enzyme